MAEANQPRVRQVGLADLTGNGFVDAFVVNGRGAGSDTPQTPNTVWFNDGQGRFIVGQGFDYDQGQAMAVGDVTGNGIVDIFVAGVESYRVWRGVGNGPGPPTAYR